MSNTPQNQDTAEGGCQHPPVRPLMRFQVGQYYQHASGRVIHILGQIHTFFHGSCLLAEEDTGTLVPVGSDEDSAQNWHQVSGFSRSCYAGNNIPDPIEPTPLKANWGLDMDCPTTAWSNHQHEIKP